MGPGSSTGIVFLTVSPNEQHSAMVLRLSRFRQNDPYIQHGDSTPKKLSRRDYPLLAGKRRKTDHETNDDDPDTVSADLPVYDLRRVATARDPLAVVEGFRVEIFLKLAAILGVRMCPRCPRCNDGKFGCQDKFGNNMRPMGGVLGGMNALGGAGENQGNGTPHLHAEGHIVCAYQYGTLTEIAEKIRQGFFAADAVKKHQGWLHHEDILDEEEYAAFRPKVEQEWRNRFASVDHDFMSVLPSYLVEDAEKADPLQFTTAKTVEQREKLDQDAKIWKRDYLKDVQYIFSRVQHHVHRKTKTGYAPLKACTPKMQKKNGCCKADFPKTATCVKKPVLICRGLARRYGLRISGRRNALGTMLGRRRCEWESGTSPSFAALFRSNSHTLPNFRLPPMQECHEDPTTPEKRTNLMA